MRCGEPVRAAICGSQAHVLKSGHTVGIGYHELQFLRFAAKHAKFGRVATIGRQRLFLQKEQVRALMGLPGREYKHDNYCDGLLVEYFGATCVDSWDYSDYERATYIVDMNEPLKGKSLAYDTVIDAGTVEHIYNAPQALRNVSELCREGGQILHILPGNNFCGHGFWQFSPELFFSLYSESNGYSETRVFLASEYQTRTWYEVAKPEWGKRANVMSFTPVFVLCRTVKIRKSYRDAVQQSDYVRIWQQDGSSMSPQVQGRPRWKARIASALQMLALGEFACAAYTKLSGKWSLSARNPHLTKRMVKSLAG
jgi:hypothetical protein